MIDARLPRECEENHIPEAVNLPVVNNEEYAEVGSLHRANKSRQELSILESRSWTSSIIYAAYQMQELAVIMAVAIILLALANRIPPLVGDSQWAAEPARWAADSAQEQL